MIWFLFHLTNIILVTSQEQQCGSCTCVNTGASCQRSGKVITGPFPKSLTIINAQNSQIEEIKTNNFGNIPALKIIRIDQSKLTNIESGAFYGLPQLIEVNLESNKIKELPEELFESDAPLTEGVKLRYNNIKKVPIGLLANMKGILYLNDNKIHCDCETVIPNHLKLKVSGTCFTPGYIRGQKISELTYGDIKCEQCLNNPCVNGVCTKSGKSFKCSCYNGYFGDNCDLKNTVPTTTSTTSTTSSSTRNTTTTIYTNPTQNTLIIKKTTTPQSTTDMNDLKTESTTTKLTTTTTSTKTTKDSKTNKARNKLKKLKQVKICVRRKQRNCKTISEVSEMLKNITKQFDLLESSQLADVSNLIEYISSNLKESDNEERINVVSNMFTSINNVLLLPSHIIAKAEKKYQSSRKILKSLEVLPTLVLANSKKDLKEISIQMENIGMTTKIISKSDYDLDVTGKLTGRIARTEIDFFINDKSDDDSLNNGVDRFTIKIPKENFQHIPNVQISSFIYRNGKYFMTEDELLNNSKRKTIDGFVLSAKIGNHSFLNLTKPIEIVFRNVTSQNAECKFWDFNMKTSIPGVFGGWSSKGCQKIPSNEVGVIRCQCNHLTNFALILNVEQKFNHNFVLTLITWIGCGISIAGLSITIVAHLLIRSTSKLAPKILISLCFALLGVYIVFLAGIERTSRQKLCQSISFILQYFMLAAFTWMFIEGINMYRYVIKVFSSILRDERCFFYRLSVIGWGAPFLVVIVTFIFKQKEFGNKDFCIATGMSFYYGLLLPICLILLVNWVIMFLVVLKLNQTSIVNYSQRKTSVKTQLWRIFFCSIILGLTWTFGVFTFVSAVNIFQYLFCITNSLQGFFILIVYVLGNKDVLLQLKTILQKRSRTSSNELYVTSKSRLPKPSVTSMQP